MSSGEYTRLIDANVNIFGLTQYDGLTQFFAEGTYALPQVRTPAASLRTSATYVYCYENETRKGCMSQFLLQLDQS